MVMLKVGRTWFCHLWAKALPVLRREYTGLRVSRLWLERGTEEMAGGGGEGGEVDYFLTVSHFLKPHEKVVFT